MEGGDCTLFIGEGNHSKIWCSIMYYGICIFIYSGYPNNLLVESKVERRKRK